MRTLKQLAIVGALFELACAGATTSEEDSQRGARSPTVGGSASPIVATGGQIVTHSLGGGGTSSSVSAAPSGSSTILLGDETVAAPTYDRSCIRAALAASSEIAGGSAGSTGIGQGGASSSFVAAAGMSSHVSAADLGLGSGDLTVLVLFDQSGSMASGWDERTKWQVANDSLMNAIEPVLDLVTIGTIFFPQPGECEVAALDSGQQINYLSGRDFRATWEETKHERGPNGSTPLHLAMQLADQAIESACQWGLLERRFRVVIVTDGAPNCGVDESKLPLLPTEWRRLGIETRVMGLPGSQSALDLMDRIAAAGGSDHCISLGTPQQMQAEMGAAML